MPAKLLWERIPQVPSCFPSSVMPPRSIRLSSVRGKKIGEILHMAVASPTCMLRSYQSGTRAALIPYAFGWRLYLWTCTSIYLPHLPQQRPSHSSAGSILSVTFHLRFRSAIPELVCRRAESRHGSQGLPGTSLAAPRCYLSPFSSRKNP